MSNPSGYKVQVQATFTYWATATTPAEARANIQSWMENAPEDMLASEYTVIDKWSILEVSPATDEDDD